MSEPLSADTNFLSGAAFKPYLDHMTNAYDKFKNGAPKVADIVPHVRAASDGEVRQMIGIYTEIGEAYLSFLAHLSTQDADQVNAFVKMVSKAEAANADEAGGSDDSGRK